MALSHIPLLFVYLFMPYPLHTAPAPYTEPIPMPYHILCMMHIIRTITRDRGIYTHHIIYVLDKRPEMMASPNGT